MSHTRRDEGTLRVFPLLTEASAYIALRPFFRPIRSETPASKEDPKYSEDFLSADNWTVSNLSRPFAYADQSA